MGTDEEQSEREPIMYVQVGPYLSKLRVEESARPPGKQREIPSQKDLADALGMTPQGFSKFVNNHNDLIDRKKIARLIFEFRKRGFPTTYDDIFGYGEVGKPLKD
jgi:hypothetical protein